MVADSPFDGVAAGYDAGFTSTRLGTLLRQLARDTAAPHLEAGSRVLEIGCGTGEDALWLAGREMSVVATDPSQAMLTVAAEKIRWSGLEERVTLCQCRAEDLRVSGITGQFDSVFSNFGAMNCVTCLPPLAEWLAQQVRPGGKLILVVMGRWCIWDVAWQLSHGRPGAATRRWSRTTASARVGASSIEIAYPTPRTVTAAFAPAFRPRMLAGLGVLLPTSDYAAVVERHPAAFDRLSRWERVSASWWPFRHLGDHYILVLERRAAPDDRA